MKELIKLGTRLACSTEVSQAVNKEIDEDKVAIPTRRRAIANEVRVDLLACLCERERLKERSSWKYLLIDASPQHFWQMLNSRVLELSFPVEWADLEILRFSRLSRNGSERR